MDNTGDCQKIKDFTQNVEMVTILALLNTSEDIDFFTRFPNPLTMRIHYTIWLLFLEENCVHFGDCVGIAMDCKLCESLNHIQDAELLVKYCNKTWGKEDLRRIISNLIELNSCFPTKEFFADLDFSIYEVENILETTRRGLRQDKLARKQFFIENNARNWG